MLLSQDPETILGALKLEGEQLKITERADYLGVILDKKLS